MPLCIPKSSKNFSDQEPTYNHTQVRQIQLLMLDTENKKWSNQNQYVMLINYDIQYIPLSHYSLHSGSSKLPCHHFRRTNTQISCTRNDSGSPEGEVCRGNMCRTTPLNSNRLSCVHSQHVNGRFSQAAQVRPCHSYHTQSQGKEDTILQTSAFTDYFYQSATLHL